MIAELGAFALILGLALSLAQARFSIAGRVRHAARAGGKRRPDPRRKAAPDAIARCLGWRRPRHVRLDTKFVTETTQIEA